MRVISNSIERLPVINWLAALITCTQLKTHSRKSLKKWRVLTFYLLKMILYQVGYSYLNEKMDHRFIVPGKTRIWKDGHIPEENRKENQVSFWIAKHNRYSDVPASKEVERIKKLRQQSLNPSLPGSPNVQPG